MADGAVLRARLTCWTCPAGWCSGCGWPWSCVSRSSGRPRLARAIGVRSDLACIVGGLAFALSPRMLTVLGPSSIEVWPSALAPVGAAAARARRRARARRVAARPLSALAVAMVGGVNAAAPSAPCCRWASLWLLTRDAGPAPARDDAVVAASSPLLATLWWLVPLFLLGSYSPPFLDFIETAGDHDDPDRRWPTRCAAPPTGCRTSTRGRGPGATSSATSTSRSTAPSCSRPASRGSRCGARRTGCSSSAASSPACSWSRWGTIGDVQGWFAPASRTLLDGVARAAAQRAQVRPRGPAAAGPRPGLARRRPGRAAARERGRHAWRVRGSTSASSPGIVAFAVLASASPACGRPHHPERRLRGRPGLLARGRGLARRRAGPGGGAARARHHRSGRTCGARRATSRSRRWRPARGRSATRCRSRRRATSGCSTPSRTARAGARSPPGSPPTCGAAASSTSSCATTSTRGRDIADPVLVHQASTTRPASSGWRGSGR